MFWYSNSLCYRKPRFNNRKVIPVKKVLYSVAEKARNFAVFYLVDITQVPDFNKMYELYDPCTVMVSFFRFFKFTNFKFFFRNKHIMIDLGTGNNNKINWAIEDKQEFIDIVGKSILLTVLI